MAVAAVLVVDEDMAAAASARAILSAAGYTANDAVSGRRTLQRIAANPPDVLITEIFMPECDGIELIIAVKANHPATRIIAVTGRRMMGAVDLLDLASMLGADAILDKPVKAETLLATVERLVGPAVKPD